MINNPKNYVCVFPRTKSAKSTQYIYIKIEVTRQNVLREINEVYIYELKKLVYKLNSDALVLWHNYKSDEVFDIFVGLDYRTSRNGSLPNRGPKYSILLCVMTICMHIVSTKIKMKLVHYKENNISIRKSMLLQRSWKTLEEYTHVLGFFELNNYEDRKKGNNVATDRESCLNSLLSIEIYKLVPREYFKAERK
ncbi:hypothetical protein PHYBLDRAFT_166830 [Phycomyces blakesleeanus NRRL 1555(-)]|uniref:Uncharacterized protein n=1 Tax=Phycomyces blakesleeanus (strain ATCC 8743b / DSM 1359 / FGSC 10004 / NBRC 33097 / NRRL 1555) TaxID=763407 RepID=A0A167NBG9_PHYB8|nr:hypothetical protein PHYBLDRAFT_166830 [Phycomyces blakesleeanus NRRL 1555(-)]OAD75599.1 hypothetical protein PHYBLDRAFT_166830 [Phycomyces blakesleeanus NRRL 1555(-)]|eukprot:XP_018293639.1 hypothetical protein PHYBLDRAFT_166830 [Phycomyces blakesleeanus NRRL 1555(-)]